jgi:hypothetical protein
MYTLPSTKLDIRTEQILPVSEGGRGVREGPGNRGRNGTNNVCTYE